MTLTKARKTHPCEICFQAILPGEYYVNMTWTPWQCTGDGYLHLKACRFCYEHTAARWDYSWREGWTKYELCDALCEYSLEWMRRLAQDGLAENDHRAWWRDVWTTLQENTPEALKRLVNIL